jgi:tetratricopeptide (TPR) repeat protein
MTNNFRHVRANRSMLLFSCALLGVMGLKPGPLFALQRTGATSETNALLAQARSLAAEGKLAEAEIVLSKAEVLSPERTEVLTLLGKVEGRLAEYPQAVTVFRRIVELQPRSPDSHLNLAIALADDKNLESALDETAAAIALAPHSAVSHLMRARILDDLHRRREAEAEFTVVSKLDPNNADCLYYWSLLERDEGNLGRETELLERLVKLRPDDVRAWLSLGRSLSEQSRDEEAIPALRKAVLLDPDAAEALYLLARKLQRKDPAEYQELMQRFQQARDKSKDLDAIKKLGNEAYQAFQRQELPESIHLFREALALCDQCSISPSLHRDLGLVLCRDGQVEQGRAELQRALAMDPSDRDSARALDLLSQPATSTPSSKLP